MEQRKTFPERKELRLKDYDYSQPGAYFVTMCTKDRKNLFGTVDDEEMRMNDVGRIAEHCWKEIPRHFSNIELDQFVVMPNHIHGIIIILDKPCGDVQLNIPTKDQTTNPTTNVDSNYHSRISPKRGTLGVIVRTFKAAVTTECRRSGHHDFAWQSLYYDHIIRDERSLTRIREYILNNPLRWFIDRNNPDDDGPNRSDRWLKPDRKLSDGAMT